MKIRQLLQQNSLSISFEVFPPKTESGFDSVRTATEEIIDQYANSIDHVHVYSMNKPDVTAKILDNLSDILGE